MSWPPFDRVLGALVHHNETMEADGNRESKQVLKTERQVTLPDDFHEFADGPDVILTSHHVHAPPHQRLEKALDPLKVAIKAGPARPSKPGTLAIRR